MLIEGSTFPQKVEGQLADVAPESIPGVPKIKQYGLGYYLPEGEGRERRRASSRWEREIGKELEKLIFYGKEKDPRFDINKAMTVTDASLESVNLLEVALCRIFSTKDV